MVNKVELIGRLGADPEIKVLDNGTKMAKFSVATEDYLGKDESGNYKTETSWHYITFFGKTAENVERLLKKGSLVRVEARLRYRTVESDSGNTRYTDINGLNFNILADGRKAGEENSLRAGIHFEHLGKGHAGRAPHHRTQRGQSQACHRQTPAVIRTDISI